MTADRKPVDLDELEKRLTLPPRTITRIEAFALIAELRLARKTFADMEAISESEEDECEILYQMRRLLDDAGAGG